MNQAPAPVSKHKWLKSALPVSLLLVVAAGATAYFPKSAKGSAPTVTATDPGPRPLPGLQLQRRDEHDAVLRDLDGTDY